MEHESPRRARSLAVLLAFGLLSPLVTAHAGGQEREPDRGHRSLPPFGAKVVTEHVPVLPIPGIWRAPARREAPKPEAVRNRMGFRAAPNEATARKSTSAPAKPGRAPAKTADANRSVRTVPLVAPERVKPADVTCGPVGRCSRPVTTRARWRSSA